MGRRSYRNILTLFRTISGRTNLERIPLIATDGFAFYAKVIRRVFGPRVSTDRSSRPLETIVS